jgi:hypothetical protein
MPLAIGAAGLSWPGGAFFLPAMGESRADRVIRRGKNEFIQHRPP